MSASFSIVITCHREKGYLNYCLRSVKDNLNLHLSLFPDSLYEIILVLDSADVETIEIAQNWVKSNNHSEIIHTSNKDVGLSRNLGISSSIHDYIFLLDGDDCWGISWLTKSLQQIIHDDNLSILHPELVIYREQEIEKVRQHIGTDDAIFDAWVLSYENIWTSSFLCPRRLFDSIVFPSGSTNPSEIYSYEDWSFFRESCNLSIPHRVVPKTVHLVNKKLESNTISSSKLNQIPWPSNLFINLLKVENHREK